MRRLLRMFGIGGERATKAAKIDALQVHSDRTLARVRAVEEVAERDRIVSAVAHTVRAIRRGPTRDH